MLQIVADEAPAYGVRLSAAQLEQLQRYHDLLVARSATANLVGDASTEVLQRRHILESIAFGGALREREILKPDSSIVDVGAGAGFPGIVLAIVWPTVQLTLIEATTKKAAFLRDAAAEAGLPEARVLDGRAEDLGRDETLRESFDLVVARAVAPLRVLLELTLPFARVGGRVATPKGSRAETELNEANHALEQLHGRAFSMPLRVPGPAQTLIVVRKEASSPPEYPRRAGQPAKNPL